MTDTTLSHQDVTDVVVLVGSLRAESVNRRLAERLRDAAPRGVRLEIAEGLGELPFYNQDLDGEHVPANVQALRDRVADADRVLVVTPEFNGTMPAVINNAIDWLSRPFGAGALRGKPLAVVGASFGRYGGQWAHEDTRKSARVAGAQVLEVSASLRPEGEDPLSDADVERALHEALLALVDHTEEQAA